MYKDPRIVVQLEAITDLCDRIHVLDGEVKAINLDGDHLSIKHSTRKGVDERREYYWSDNHKSWISEADILSKMRALGDALEFLHSEASKLSRGVPSKAFDEAMSTAELMIQRGRVS